MNLLTVISNRATYTRHSVLLEELEANPRINLSIFLTGSMEEGLAGDIRHKHDTAECILTDIDDISRASNKISKSLRDYICNTHDYEPEAIMIIGDRWELLPCAMVAAYQDIPIIHIQGGEDSSNIDQKVRWAVSSLADLHLVSHVKASQRLIRAGMAPVYVTGCPSLDLIVRDKIERSRGSHDYVVALFHPHTNEKIEAGVQTGALALAVSDWCRDNNATCYWFAPNNDPGCDAVRRFSETMEPIENIDGAEFLRLLAGARMVVGNSSCGIRECSFLGVPAVNVGRRQFGRVHDTNIIHSSFDNIAESMDIADKLKCERSTLFGNGDSSGKIIRRIEEWWANWRANGTSHGRWQRGQE